MSHSNNTSDHQLNGHLQAAARAEISGGVSGNNLHQWSSSSILSRALFRCPHCDVVIVHYHYLLTISFQSLPLWCFNCRIFNPQWEYLVATADFTRTENIDNNGGHSWNIDDQQRWEYQNNSDAQRTEEEEEEVYKKGRQEIIWKYLMTKDRRKCGNNEKEEEKEICVICQKEFEENEIFKRLDCCHDYHYECINQWLLHKNSCPLCIRTIIPSDYESEFDIVFNYD